MRLATSPQRWHRGGVGWVYQAPALIVLGMFWILPAVLGLGFSLFHWNYGANPMWVGLHEYVLVLTDPLFWQALVNTLEFAAGVVVFGTALALALALILFGRIAGKGFFRTLLFIPYVMPLVASSTIWLWMYQPGVGLFDRLLATVGITANIAWVSNPSWALPALVLFTIWYSLGFTTLLFLAGLTNVSPELDEAAQIDGATPWQRFRFIIWPLLTPTTLFVVIVNTIGVFQSFTQIFALTRGGPIGSTTTLTYLVYQYAFQYFHFGVGSAAGVLLLIAVGLLTALQFLVSRRYVVYGD